MRLGVTFPQTECGRDPAFIRDFAQTAEGHGYRHLLVYDHVLGSDPERGRPGPYNKNHLFHEPLMMLAYVAASTSRIELATGVLVLPQRQTALVAKQVSELDVLSGGRVRLGVGTGWNDVEYTALNENFANRGRRQEEQIALLRHFWQEDVVDFDGAWHHVPGAGINPRPERAIPIWLGGSHKKVLDRAARLADGWMPTLAPGPALLAAIGLLDASLARAGRRRADFGIDGVVNYVPGEPEKWHRQLTGWRDIGATHVTMRTLNRGLPNPSAHLDALGIYMERLVAEGALGAAGA